MKSEIILMSNAVSVINPKKHLDGDTSIMTYRGHTVLQTLVRCHFSPAYSTGQRYIYTGCAAGRIVSKYIVCISLLFLIQDVFQFGVQSEAIYQIFLIIRHCLFYIKFYYTSKIFLNI